MHHLGCEPSLAHCVLIAIIAQIRVRGAASFEIPCRRGRLSQETKDARLDDWDAGYALSMVGADAR